VHSADPNWPHTYACSRRVDKQLVAVHFTAALRLSIWDLLRTDWHGEMFSLSTSLSLGLVQWAH
jgi:hypothetical protein